MSMPEVEQPASSAAPVGSSDSKAEAPTKPFYKRTEDSCINCLHFHVECTMKDGEVLGQCRGSTPNPGHRVAREQITERGIPVKFEGRPWGVYPLMSGDELACAGFKHLLVEALPSD